LEGELPRRAMRLIGEWVEIHKIELMDNWSSAQSDLPEFKKIEPLQ